MKRNDYDDALKAMITQDTIDWLRTIYNGAMISASRLQVKMSQARCATKCAYPFDWGVVSYYQPAEICTGNGWKSCKKVIVYGVIDRGGASHMGLTDENGKSIDAVDA